MENASFYTFFFNHIYKYGSRLTYMLGDGGQHHLTCLVKSRSQSY